MNIDGKSIVELAADLVAGYVTADFIKEELGEGVLNSVLALAGGSVASVLASQIIDDIEEETGIVSDIGSLVDDVFGIFD